MHILAANMAELNADIGFVRRLVMAETGIAINPHQRATELFCADVELRRQVCHWRLHAGNECQRRFTHIVLVTGLVGIKPVALVVARQLAQKTKGFGAEGHATPESVTQSTQHNRVRRISLTASLLSRRATAWATATGLRLAGIPGCRGQTQSARRRLLAAAKSR